MVFPLPPAPRMGPAPLGGSAAPGRRHPVVRIAVGLVFVLLAGIVAVVASEPSKGDQRPIFGGERSHAFIGRTADGEPFRWDPCSTIHFQVDLGRVDDHVLDDVKEAVRRISQASGLRFEFDGVVHLSGNDLLSSGGFVTARGGLHWSPLLIAFRSQTAMRGLGVRGAYGAAFPITTRLDADQFVSGAVVVNAERRPAGRVRSRPVGGHGAPTRARPCGGSRPHPRPVPADEPGAGRDRLGQGRSRGFGGTRRGPVPRRPDRRVPGGHPTP
jgi:hypothetical protein